MFALPPTVRIFFAPGVTDMRKSFDGLSAVTREIIGLSPLSGHLFLFCNRKRNRLKILLWDRSGFWVFAKRLEKGTFAWPEVKDRESKRFEIAAERLSLLLGGIDFKGTKKRRWLDFVDRTSPIRKEDIEV